MAGERREGGGGGGKRIQKYLQPGAARSWVLRGHKTDLGKKYGYRGRLIP